tara:strand:- start:6361 stop:6885 length:525 start_codon:yes stop_codon:yes gene_type:complete
MSTKGVNKVIIIGNLGGDPEVRFMPNGTAVANFTVATSESWKDKQTGEQKEKTEWHRIVIYQRLAEIAGEYLRKGSKVYLEGKLNTRKWQNQQGQDQYTTEIIVNNMQMLDRAGGVQQQANNRQQNQGGFNQQQNHNQGGFNQQQNNNQHQRNQRPQKVNPQEPTIDFDDDIPF